MKKTTASTRSSGRNRVPPVQGAAEPGAEASLEFVAGDGQDGFETSPCGSGIGEHTACESESA